KEGGAREANGSSAPAAANDDVAKAIAALKENDLKTRAQAAARLSKSCDARAVGPLLDLLKDEDPMARAAAAEALGRLDDNDSIGAILDLTVSEKDWRV